MSRFATCAFVVLALAAAGAVSAQSPLCFNGQKSSTTTGCDFPSTTNLPASLNCSTGYTRRDVAFNWYDTADGCEYGRLPHFHDDDTDDFDLPFEFNYFGDRVNRFGISDNGFLSFYDCDENPEAYADSTRIPNPDPLLAPPGVIAVWWQDLDPSRGDGVDPDRFLRMRTFGSAPNRAFVVTWDDFPCHDLATPNCHYTFQVVLYETTNIIRMQWKTLIGGTGDSGIGIQNRAGTVGYEYTAGHNLTNKAMEWVPRPSTCLTATPGPLLTCTPTSTTAQTFPMLGATNNAFYGCSPNPHNANEYVFVLDVDRVKLVDILISSVDLNKTLRVFLQSSCSPCECIETGSLVGNRIRTVLGPGRYYVVVDGPSATDSAGNSFNIRATCEPLLGVPTGTRMTVGDPANPASCSLKVNYDRFVDGQAAPYVEGWFDRLEGNRSYYALRVDGQTTYSTAPDITECTSFDKHSVWVDDNTDTAVSYWQVEGVVEVIQTAYGNLVLGNPPCCGLRLDTKIRNLDFFPHYYEFRELFHQDFGPGTGPAPGMCENQGAVGGGPMHGGTGGGDYTLEQNLTCDSFSTPPGICAMQCSQAPEFKSADDNQTKLIIQTDPRQPATPDAVRGEWIVYEDVNRICGVTPNPWLGAVDGGSTGACVDDAGINLVWRVPPGTAGSCVACTGGCGACGCLLPRSSELACGDLSYTFTQFLGKGCRLNTGCTTCRSTATVFNPASFICNGNDTFLIADDSPIPGCPSSTVFAWAVDGVVDPAQTSFVYPLNGNDPRVFGSHTYAVVKACDPPPGGIACLDRREATVNYQDCSTCAITPAITGPAQVCTNQLADLDSADSIIANCPGAVTYSWTRADIGPLPGEDGSRLFVTEAIEGTYQYTVTITCNPPPLGLSCSATLSTPFTLIVSGSGGGPGAPLPIPNTLTAVKSLLNDVSLRWDKDPLDTVTEKYDVLRTPDRLALADQATPPPVQIPGLSTNTATDAGAVPPSPPDAVYYYRVRGLGCGNLAGEF